MSSTSSTTSTRVLLGQEHGWGGSRRPFGLSVSDLLRHAHLIGQTGAGKSTTLYNIAAQLIAAGEGLAFIDPHGQEAEALLNAIPRDRTRDIVYFNPQDTDFPIGMNLLEAGPDTEHLVAASVVEALRGLHSNSWGPRMDWILYNSLRTLAAGGETILATGRLLTDEEFRRRMIAQTRDPTVRDFWTQEFGQYNKGFRVEAISPIQNKIGRLRADPVLRGILGQRHSTIDPRFMMDDRRLLIANLSGISAAAADILGSFLATWFQVAALGRSDTSEEDRVPFLLMLDECHRFTTDQLASILSESRKYGLGMVLAHQYLGQLTEKIQAGIFGNVAATIAFRVGGADAAVLEEQFGRAFRAEQFTDLGRFTAYVKAVQGGIPTEPFRASMRPPIEANHGRRDTIIRESRRRFGRQRDVVENRLG